MIQKILCFCIIFCIFSTERSVCGKCVQCEASTLSFHMCAMRSEHTFHSRARRVRWEICTCGADNKGPVDLCSTEPTEPDFRRARHRTFESRIGLEKKSSDTIRYHCFFLERETGIEPATPSLARRCSTTEPLAHASCIIHYYIQLVKNFFFLLFI